MATVHLDCLTMQRINPDGKPAGHIHLDIDINDVTNGINQAHGSNDLDGDASASIAGFGITIPAKANNQVFSLSGQGLLANNTARGLRASFSA